MKEPANINKLLRTILSFANYDLPIPDLLYQLLNILVDFSKCDVISLFWKGNDNIYSYSINSAKEYKITHESTSDESHDSKYKSIINLPITIDNTKAGSLNLKSKKDNYFSNNDVEIYNNFSFILGFVLKNHKIQSDLKERVKELTCLYGISKIVEKSDASVNQILQEIVELLPPAFQYPGIAFSKIILDDKEYTSRNHEDSPFILSSEIIILGERKGELRVGYVKDKVKEKGIVFLKEEQKLIDTIAQQLSLIIERKQTEGERIRLQEQLRHADRLATIGQLSAGVAHELNEPLGAVLGFAQLLLKNNKLPEQVSRDMHEIVKASLHAREIIRKLMLFSKQIPPMTSRVNLNDIIKEGIYFLEARCNKENIKLMYNLDPKLPRNVADKSQLHQVIVNLVVNAMQAMPNGGEITLSTKYDDEHISLTVDDLGIGIDKEVIEQIFVPFFTTKDINQGTGLGLAVVHGIITSHGGNIDVKSELGKGSSFEIKLPITPKGDADNEQRNNFSS